MEDTFHPRQLPIIKTQQAPELSWGLKLQCTSRGMTCSSSTHCNSCRTSRTVCPVTMNTSFISSVSILHE